MINPESYNFIQIIDGRKFNSLLYNILTLSAGSNLRFLTLPFKLLQNLAIQKMISLDPYFLNSLC